MEEDKKGKSKLFLVLVLALLGYASWYFFTQFDKKHLSELIPFMDEQMIETTVIESDETNKEITVEELSIANVAVSDMNTVVEDLSIANVVVNDTNTNSVVEERVEDVVVQESTKSSESLEKEVNVSVEPLTQF